VAVAAPSAAALGGCSRPALSSGRSGRWPAPPMCD